MAVVEAVGGIDAVREATGVGQALGVSVVVWVGVAVADGDGAADGVASVLVGVEVGKRVAVELDVADGVGVSLESASARPLTDAAGEKASPAQARSRAGRNRP